MARRKNVSLDARMSADQLIQEQGWKFPVEAYEHLVDDRSHGDEHVSAASNAVWQKMFPHAGLHGKTGRAGGILETYVARVLRLADRTRREVDRENPAMPRPSVGDPISVFGKERRIAEVNQGIRDASRDIVGWMVWLDDGKKVFAKRTAGSPGKTYAARVPGKRSTSYSARPPPKSFLDNPDERFQCEVCNTYFGGTLEDFHDREGLCKKCFRYMDFDAVRSHGPVVEARKMRLRLAERGTLEGYRGMRLGTRKRNPGGLVSRQLAVGVAGQKTLTAVGGLEEASRLWSRMVAASGRGASTTPDGFVYDVSGAPRKIARISYNGSIWPLGRWTPGQQPLFDQAALRRNPGGSGALSWPATTTQFAGPYSKKNFLAYAKKERGEIDVMAHGLRSLPCQLKQLPQGRYVVYGGTTDPNRSPAKWYATVEVRPTGWEIT